MIEEDIQDLKMKLQELRISFDLFVSDAKPTVEQRIDVLEEDYSAVNKKVKTLTYRIDNLCQYVNAALEAKSKE
jgi:hypothetical protein